MKACMGGFCAVRERCPHYQSEQRAEPSERLCLRGEDGWQATENSSGGTVRRNVLYAVAMPRDAEKGQVLA